MTVRKKRQPLDDQMEAMHASAAALHRVGAMSDTTMREFDALCLAPVEPLDARAIKRIRTASRVSQPVFARYLNTSASTVRQWESGEKHPSGMALKLLQVVQNHGLDVLAIKKPTVEKSA